MARLDQRKLRNLIALYLACIVLLQGMIAWNARAFVRRGDPDFAIFYSAAKIVRAGLAKDLYDPAAQSRVKREFVAGTGAQRGSLPYNHPPFETLIFLPFASASFLVAYLLWGMLNLLILFSLPALLRSQIPLLQHSLAGFPQLASLAFFPVFIGLVQGQDVFLLLLLFSLTFASLKKEDDFSAGCWLGLGLFRFHLVLPLLLTLLLQKRKKAVVGFALVAIGLGLISLAIVGGKELAHYPLYVWRLEKSLPAGVIVPGEMPNLRGFLTSILPARTPGNILLAIIALPSLALLTFTAVRYRSAKAGSDLDLAFSLAVVVSVLVSYHAYVHDLSLLLLPALLLANYFRTAALRDKWTGVAVVAPVLILWLSPLLALLMERYVLISLLAPVLLLWGWGIIRELSRRMSQKSPAAA